MAADHLDVYIDAVSKALALPVEEAWRPAVRANLEVFADAIEGRAEYPISTAQMVDVIAGLEAIVTSMRSGNAVALTE